MVDEVKFAADCVPCPDGCGEPWCQECEEHYAECSCVGPTQEIDVSDILVVVSKVKAKVKDSELRTSAEFIEALSKRIELDVEKAVERARVAKRKTVQAEDLD